MGETSAPTFCFCFTSDEFDIYHLIDFMGPKGWRFNGQQYPNAIHMAVTRPQTQPGVVEAFAADLADAVAYAKDKHAAGEEAFAGAIYGGVAGGLDQATRDFIVDGDGRHARQAASPCHPHEAISSSPSTSARAAPRSASSRCAARGASGGSTRPCRRTLAPGGERDAGRRASGGG